MSDRPKGPLGIDPLHFSVFLFALLVSFVLYLLLPKAFRKQYFGAYPKRHAWSARIRARRGGRSVAQVRNHRERWKWMMCLFCFALILFVSPLVEFPRWRILGYWRRLFPQHCWNSRQSPHAWKLCICCAAWTPVRRRTGRLFWTTTNLGHATKR